MICKKALIEITPVNLVPRPIHLVADHLMPLGRPLDLGGRSTTNTHTSSQKSYYTRRLVIFAPECCRMLESKILGPKHSAMRSMRKGINQCYRDCRPGRLRFLPTPEVSLQRFPQDIRIPSTVTHPLARTLKCGSPIRVPWPTDALSSAPNRPASISANLNSDLPPKRRGLMKNSDILRVRAVSP